MWRYPGILHEAWICSDGNACLEFGPKGDGARALLDPESVCVIVFWAESHFDCMTFYHKLVHGETYQLPEGEEWKREPYDKDQIKFQQDYLLSTNFKAMGKETSGIPAAICDESIVEMLLQDWGTYIKQER